MAASDTLANTLFTSLTSGVDVDVPTVNFGGVDYQVPDLTGPLLGDVSKVSLEDLTTKEVDGSGVFDALMEAQKAHLVAEYKANRITGAEYTKAYIAMVQGAMAAGVQFLLGRDQAYWAAITAQKQAILISTQTATANVQLETAKLQFQTAKFEALAGEATYALTKLKLATESISYDTAVYNLNTKLPAEVLLTQEQKNLVIKQIALTAEQIEVQRGQTMNTRTDGATIVGMVGKQKDLYDQQITSYKRDAEYKGTKMFVDAWIAQKTIDEGLNPPNNFTNSELDEVLTKLRTNLNL